MHGMGFSLVIKKGLLVMANDRDVFSNRQVSIDLS